MPFTEPVSSTSGRNSRASNVSAMTGVSHSVRSGQPPAAKSNDMFSNAGVLSMLKTSTDTGDIGALSFNRSRLPAAPRPAHPRKGHRAQPSLGSSHHYPTANGSHHRYAPSQTSRISDSTSFARRGSFTSMQSMPPSLPPVNMGKTQLQMPAPTLDRSARDSRSYSLSSAPASGHLPRQRSAMSLKSAGHEPRQGHRLHPGHPPMPENRPYVYPTRLKRPGYRSPSPALSELSAQGLQMPPMPPPQQARRAPMPMQRPPMPTYNSDYGGGYGPEPQYLNVRPPPRAMDTPVMGYEQTHFGYQQPAAMRSAPTVSMHSVPYPGQRPSHGPPHQAQSQPYYARPQYGPPRPGYAPHPQMHYPGHLQPGHRGPPPPANMVPMAHNMFHNAARMARHLPQRTDTPLTEMGTPSSDPPSSGTAPSSSSPQTPKDSSTIQVAVDPLFIDANLTGLPDSSSAPVLPVKYFEYADGLEKAMDEVDIEVPHPSVPPTGFVQRVRAMLESKAVVEAAAKKEAERERATQRVEQLAIEHDTELEISELHELAANQTPRFTIIEEFDAPVELPASPVRLPELANSPARSKQRLTREMIKAELSSTSTQEDQSTQENITTTMKIDLDVQLRREPSKATTTATREEPGSTAGDLLGTPNIKRQNSTAGSAVTASPEAISGIDYALRFSAPVDTTTTMSDETVSKDPFILDADTITLQHQRSRERVAVPLPPQISLGDMKTDSYHKYLDPVSPLHPGEDVSRSSAVSPLHTHTLGIDATLRLPPSGKHGDTTSDFGSVLDVGTATEESMPPPTPRTPRTYSKSVQLRPSNTAGSGTPSKNRFSLPPDLSTVAETTMNTNSDMITDVAVRFSLPNTTITIGKPQIVTIPPSSSPEKQDSPPPKTKSRGLQPRSARRGSVTFTEQIAPLNVKKPEPRREMHYSHEHAGSRGKSIMRRPSPHDDGSDTSRVSRDSTTDLRFPAANGINSRFGSTHLADLKEESVEDMSINERHRRSSSRVESHPLQLPARIAAVKAMQERRLQESAEKSKARRAARHHNSPLAETRDLPSLNFSRMDLIDKLNEALEIRPAKSMEVVRRRDFSPIYCPSPQRPQSTEPLRERYTSFFSKPADFSMFEELEDDDLDADPEQGDGIPVVEVQESTKLEDVEEPGSRPLSPEDFLNVATQVNRLSIPSVTGLSDRLTSLLPCLKNLHLDSILASDEEVALTIEDIHHLGNGGRPETVLSTRTSAGFRTLAERAEEIVNNGTHDSMVPMSRLLLTNKELPALPESASADKVSAINSTDGKQSYLSGSVSAPSELGKDLARPSLALVRQKSPLNEEEVRQLLPPEMNPITRGQRSLVISSASRPWNQDENYPWAGTNVPVDLTIPSEVHLTESTIGKIRRRSKSVDFASFGEATDTIKGIDIGSINTNMDCSSITTEQATGVVVKANHFRSKSKRSIIGSLSKKMGLTHRSGYEDLTRSTASPGIRSDESLPHKPGERYPTSSLTPPVNMHLDEVRSFFSDNSSERQRRTTQSTFPKRLTRFKGGNKGKAVRLDPTSAATRGASMDQTISYSAGSLNAEREGAMSAAHTYDGVGMGKAEFRIKRFGEKLRHLFAKGGDLIRSLSNRSKMPRTDRERDDWLSDSLYSGV
ncbi:hypothetical protein LTR36_007562 [Oleoguttula mirabilis]|uniref:Uncharacterized protein n=1 Tax=Oleoguttula mirabilis TaxID=1507867 RepID=A0AAV9JTR8_9PEZI|nr:hypothetical protein LTR36_007562 [Oleoguttula mirabilis]